MYSFAYIWINSHAHYFSLFLAHADLTLAQNRRPSTSARSLGVSPKSQSSGTDFNCPEEFGYYPHPNDCTQYYVCVFGGALLESCTGGLMYSHELQTCDWPRNVGCEVTENSGHIDREVARVVPHVQQSHKFRFSSLQNGPTSPAPSRQPQQLPLQQQQQPQYQQQHQQQQQQQHQVYQAQVQAIPPPPELRVAPNPVVTSRGQPKLIEQQNIAKVMYI